MQFYRPTLVATLFFLFTVFSLSAQNQFQKLYVGDQSSQTLIDLASNGDVFFVNSGHNPSINVFFSRILVQRLDQNTNILDTVALTVGSGYLLQKMLPTSGNGLIIAGTKAAYSSDNDSVFVIKLNDSLQVSWSKGFQFDKDEHEVYQIFETNDGGFIVYGTFADFITSDVSVFVIKLNSLGNKIWSREIKSQTNGVSLSAGGIVEVSNGDLWISASELLNSSGSWAAKLNSSGIIQSVNLYKTHKLTNSTPMPMAMFERSNGDRDLFYNRTSFQDSTFLLMLRTNSSGTPISTKVFKSNVYSSGGEVLSVKPKGTNGYLITGVYWPNPLSFFSSGFVLELNSNDNIVWSKSYGTPSYEIAFGTVPTTDGGFLIGGMADFDSLIVSPSEEGLFPWLVKTNGSGVTNCYSNNFSVVIRNVTTQSNSWQLNENAGANVAKSKFKYSPYIPIADTVVCKPIGIEDNYLSTIKIYPNPTNGRIHIDLREVNSIDKITLTDVLGNVISKKNVDNNQESSIEINRPAGIYLLTIYAKNGQIHTYKIMKE